MTFDLEHVIKHASITQKIELLSGSDFWHTAALQAFNVPKVRLSDGPNGIRGTRFFAGTPAACIPCGTALGATWDKGLIRQAGELLGKECIAKGVHCWLGPTINIQRSPLGGRGFESFSEDPHLSGILAAEIIKGCESTGVMATPKHFVCNDQEHERRAVSVIITERALREVYLRPFQIVARDASPGCLMTAYNKVNGNHVSQDYRLLELIVRSEWKWDPLVVSDWYGTYSTIEAITAGLDLEMPGKTRYRGATAEFALSARMFSQSTLERRVRRVLEFAQKASKVQVASSEGIRDEPEDRLLNRKLCAQSIVLLKNDHKVLPISKSVRKIALIGSHMKTPAISGGGSASLEPYYVVSPYEAIQEKLKGQDVEIAYEVGAQAYKMLTIVGGGLIHTPDTFSQGGIIRFYNEPASVHDRAVICTEHLTNLSFQLMDYNKNPSLNYDLFYARAEAIFTPDSSGIWDFGLTVCGTAMLYLDGKLLINNATSQKPGSSFFGKGTAEETGSTFLEANKRYHIMVDFGSSSTSTIKHVGVVSFGGGGARIGASLRLDAETGIARAVAAAATSEYAVICTGLNGDWESEGVDRPNMELPPGIETLITRVLEANPNAIVVTQGGTPFTMTWHEKAKALVHAWYGGNEIGNGIADVLFGDVNPSAKLPLSWPFSLKDNPSYLNFGSTNGRVLYGEDIYVGYKYYDYVSKDVLFQFGHGLSYTSFELSRVAVEGRCVIVDVLNKGSVAGSETVQVYISVPKSSTSRPIRELHGFEKVYIEPGATSRLKIHIDQYAGSLWDESEDKWLLEKGEYEVLVGTSLQSAQKAGKFVVQHKSHWLGLRAPEDDQMN